MQCRNSMKMMSSANSKEVETNTKTKQHQSKTKQTPKQNKTNTNKTKQTPTKQNKHQNKTKQICQASIPHTLVICWDCQSNALPLKPNLWPREPLLKTQQGTGCWTQCWQCDQLVNTSSMPSSQEMDVAPTHQSEAAHAPATMSA